MSISASFSILLSAITLINVTGLRWCALDFIYCEGSDMWHGTGFVVTYTVSFILLAAVLLFSLTITRPFDKVVTRIKKNGGSATEEEVTRCLTCYKKLNRLVLICNLTGFFIGQIIISGIGVMQGRTPRDFQLLFTVVAQAVGFGMVSCLTMMNAMDLVLAPMRKLLRIRSLKNHEKARYLNISQSLSLTAFCMVYFVAMNMFTIYFGETWNAEFSGASYSNIVEAVFRKGLLCLVISAAFSFWPTFILIRGLNNRIKTTAENIEKIAEQSDLTQRIDITMIDDFGMLTTDINTLISRLSSMLREIKSGAVAIADSASTLSDSALTANDAIERMNDSFYGIAESCSNQNVIIHKTDLSLSELADNIENVMQSVVSQTSAMQKISTAMTGMTENISSVASVAFRAQQVSENLSETSSSGEGSIKNAVTTMKQIHSASEEVQSILRVIQKISAQTNLLSMNASIEAAHAGDVGQGFAVVADEVRALASSSTKSAKEIQTRIKDMSDRIEAGVYAISQAGNAFRDITDRVAENAGLINQIYEAIEKQRTGARQTERATQDALIAVNCVQALAQSEAVNAEGVRGFMKEVVEASKETDRAIAVNSDHTERLSEAVSNVADAARRNAESVNRMNQHIIQYEVGEEE